MNGNTKRDVDPIFIPSIIFFIMSSISSEPPLPPVPMDRAGIGPPLDEVSIEDEDDEELEKDMEDFVEPSEMPFRIVLLKIEWNLIKILIYQVTRWWQQSFAMLTTSLASRRFCHRRSCKL